MLDPQPATGLANGSYIRRVQSIQSDGSSRDFIPDFSVPRLVGLTQYFIKQRKHQRKLVEFLSAALHEPESQIRIWLKENERFLSNVESYRNKRQRESSLNTHLRSFQCFQEKDFRNLCITDDRSRLLVSYHFGDFVYGNNVLAGMEDRTRQQSFLTQLRPSDNFLQNMYTCFGETEFNNRTQLILGSSSAAELLALLRKPNQTVLSFVDLPYGFGERVAIRFLGRRAWFPKGPATLCLASKAPILPVINLRIGSQNRIYLGEQIEPELQPLESFHDAVVRITQLLVDLLEEFAVIYPWQWRFLGALPSFYLEPPIEN